jgi:SNF2 family DNA or RNA helicase
VRDVWSLVDFVLPGYLGECSSFLKAHEDHSASPRELASLVGPVLLRRRVRDVAADLPERIDIPQPLVMDHDTARQYESERVAAETASAHMTGFAGLVRLRMTCADIRLLDLDFAGGRESPKSERLREILEEIAAVGEKTIVFTSFRRTIDAIVAQYSLGVAWFIDGRVPVEDRQRVVDEFSSWSGAAILVLNPRAAGTGLNITAANHIVHYNPEWNPAIEDQATARAYRRGQTLPVTVHRLFYRNSIEEVMVERLERKRVLAEEAVPSTSLGDEADAADLLRAIRVSPIAPER